MEEHNRLYKEEQARLAENTKKLNAALKDTGLFYI